jgi:hypothetical protein
MSQVSFSHRTDKLKLEAIIMGILDKIKLDHHTKSNEVKRLKKKMKYKTKHTVTHAHLQMLLSKEKKSTIDSRDYMYDFDDTTFNKDIAKKEARIELLEDLLRGY